MKTQCNKRLGELRGPRFGLLITVSEKISEVLFETQVSSFTSIVFSSI